MLSNLCRRKNLDLIQHILTCAFCSGRLARFWSLLRRPEACSSKSCKTYASVSATATSFSLWSTRSSAWHFWRSAWNAVNLSFSSRCACCFSSSACFFAKVLCRFCFCHLSCYHWWRDRSRWSGIRYSTTSCFSRHRLKLTIAITSFNEANAKKSLIWESW